MARKKEETIIDKKTREKIKIELLEEINTTIKDELCVSVVEDVKNIINNEYKENLKKDISNEIIIDIKDEIKHEQKKLIRRKNFKIFRLYIYIILLLSVSLFLIYRLYVTGNMDIIKNNDKLITTTTSQTTIKTTESTKDEQWYYNNYAYLLDNIYITNYELLKGNFLVADIAIADKLAMSYKTLNEEQITQESVIFSVLEDDLKKSYEELFGSLNGYSATNFTIDGLNYAYSLNNKAFIAVGSKSDNNSYVVNNIINIKEVNEDIVIMANVALIKDNKIYNVFDQGKELGEYTNENLIKLSDSLSIVEYSFSLINDNYYISAINKK